jgi:prevent-host-death family protein
MYIQMYTLRMLRSYSVAQARAHLPELLDEVEEGNEVEITRRGRPVAVLVSTERLAALQGRRPTFGELHRRFIEGHPGAELGLDLTGVRDRAPGRKVRL